MFSADKFKVTNAGTSNANYTWRKKNWLTGQFEIKQ
jgi:hypothetical protein